MLIQAITLFVNVFSIVMAIGLSVVILGLILEKLSK